MKLLSLSRKQRDRRASTLESQRGRSHHRRIGSAHRRAVALIGPSVHLAARLLKEIEPSGLIAPQATIEKLRCEDLEIAKQFTPWGTCMIVRGFEEDCVTAYHIPPSPDGDIAPTAIPSAARCKNCSARRYCEELRVTPLGEAAVMDYLCGRFGEVGLPKALTTTLVRRTGGNPLFLVNMVDDLVRHVAVTEVDGRWIARKEQVTELGERVPDTLRQLIERQVERLPVAEQRLLEVASVAGVEFASVDVAAGLLTAVEEVETSCERFARAEQWLRTAGLAEWPDGTLSGRYSFLHALYHEVIYARVAEARRVQLHRRIAERKAVAYGERKPEIAAELAVHFETEDGERETEGDKSLTSSVQRLEQKPRLALGCSDSRS